MTALLYNLLLFLASPALGLYLAYRLLIKGKSREGFLQRLGFSPRLGPPGRGGRVWLHAVSAGEVAAASAIARRLAESSAETEIVISCTTPAGRAQAERLLPDAAAWLYFPFDFLPCVLTALIRVRPTVIAAVETEIWPNWLWAARLLGIRAALVNGQFADRGFARARRARWLYRWSLSCLDQLLMQSPRAGERALFLGAEPDKVRIVGNVKFEQSMPLAQPEVEAAVRRQLPVDAPVLIAGSTHPGEEEQILTAYRSAREQLGSLALILAPRHVERSAEVAGTIEREGLSFSLRSSERAGPVDVVLLDTMGELAGLYAVADVAFIGGSLVPIGGHDILQPLFFGRPVLFGPHMHNQRDLVELALAEGAAIQVHDAGMLAEAVSRLVRDSAERDRIRLAGGRLLRDNAGAARECASVLASLARGDRIPSDEHGAAEQRVCI